MSVAIPSLDTSAAMALGRLADARAPAVLRAVRTLLPDGDIGAAYAVQAAWVAGRVAPGDSVIGRKIGLTSRGMTRMAAMTARCQRDQATNTERPPVPKSPGTSAAYADALAAQAPYCRTARSSHCRPLLSRAPAE